MKDGFIFYKSFADGIRRLGDADRLKAYDAIIDFAVYGLDVECDGMAGVVFDLAKPQIEANNRRYENGCKGKEYGKLGGRPKKQNDDQHEEPKATPKKTGKEAKKSYGKHKNVKLTEKELTSLQSDFGDEATKEAIAYLDSYIEEKGYKSKSHYLAMRRWVFNAVEEHKDKYKKQANVISPANRFGTFQSNHYSADDMAELESRLLEN